MRRPIDPTGNADLEKRLAELDSVGSQVKELTEDRNQLILLLHAGGVAWVTIGRAARLTPQACRSIVRKRDDRLRDEALAPYLVPREQWC